LWAQRGDVLYVTINVSDLQENPSLDFTEKSLSFEGKTSSSDKVYKVDLEFFDEIKKDVRVLIF